MANERTNQEQIDPDLIEEFTSLTKEQLWDSANRDVLARHGDITHTNSKMTNREDSPSGAVNETNAYYQVINDLQDRLKGRL